MEQRGNVNSDYCYQRSGSSMVANSPHESSVQVISVIEYHIETIYIYIYIYIHTVIPIHLLLPYLTKKTDGFISSNGY